MQRIWICLQIAGPDNDSWREALMEAFVAFRVGHVHNAENKRPLMQQAQLYSAQLKRHGCQAIKREQEQQQYAADTPVKSQ